MGSLVAKDDPKCLEFDIQQNDAENAQVGRCNEGCCRIMGLSWTMTSGDADQGEEKTNYDVCNWGLTHEKITGRDSNGVLVHAPCNLNPDGTNADFWPYACYTCNDTPAIIAVFFIFLVIALLAAFMIWKKKKLSLKGEEADEVPSCNTNGVKGCCCECTVTKCVCCCFGWHSVTALWRLIEACMMLGAIGHGGHMAIAVFIFLGAATQMGISCWGCTKMETAEEGGLRKAYVLLIPTFVCTGLPAFLSMRYADSAFIFNAGDGLSFVVYHVILLLYFGTFVNIKRVGGTGTEWKTAAEIKAGEGAVGMPVGAVPVMMVQQPMVMQPGMAVAAPAVMAQPAMGEQPAQMAGTELQPAEPKA